MSYRIIGYLIFRILNALGVDSSNCYNVTSRHSTTIHVNMNNTTTTVGALWTIWAGGAVGTVGVGGAGGAGILYSRVV